MGKILQKVTGKSKVESDIASLTSAPPKLSLTRPGSSAVQRGTRDGSGYLRSTAHVPRPPRPSRTPGPQLPGPVGDIAGLSAASSSDIRRPEHRIECVEINGENG